MIKDNTTLWTVFQLCAVNTNCVQQHKHDRTSIYFEYTHSHTESIRDFI